MTYLTPTGVLPPTMSMLKVGSPLLVLSAVRRSERDTLIVRLYNITREPITSTITFAFPLDEVHLTTLSEERQTQLELSAGKQITVNARGGQVITLEIIPKRES